MATAKACVVITPEYISSQKKISKLNNRFLLYKKSCISYRKLCYLYFYDDKWHIKYFTESNTIYSFSPNNYEHFINILQNLGLSEGKYRIKLLNSFNNIFNIIHLKNLDDTLDWCYNTQKALLTVQMEYMINYHPICHTNQERLRSLVKDMI